jgi:hypothetical protein
MGTCKQPRTKKKEDSKWYWSELKKQALELELLKETDIEFVEKARQKGHFSAHIAIKQEENREILEKATDPLFEKWQKENETRVKKGLSPKPPPITSGFKRWTSEDEALETLINTKDILVKIISNYFKSEKTRSR